MFSASAEDDLQATPTHGRDSPQSPDYPTQVTWSFLHRGETPLAQTLPYELRQQLQRRFPQWPHFEASLRSSKAAMSVVARTPLASAWLNQHMGQVMGLVANVANRPLPIDSRSSAPKILFKDRHLYYIRTLIVANAKKATHWEHWRSEELDTARREELAKMISDDVTGELRRWSVIREDETLHGVVVTNVGRPMPIVPRSGPRGIARIGVTFLAPWAIDGHVFAGHHTLMGYGLIKRGGVVSTPSGNGLSGHASLGASITTTTTTTIGHEK